MRGRSDLRNGIEASARKRLAAGEAAQSEPDSPASAKTLDGFARVGGAGRIKSAGGKIQRRKKRLIGAEKQKQSAGGDARAIFHGPNNFWRNSQLSALRNRLSSSSVSRENSMRATVARG